MKYRTTYVYDSPGRAGPHKGAMTTDARYQRGDNIAAPFGRATVKSCRAIKIAAPAVPFVDTCCETA